MTLPLSGQIAMSDVNVELSKNSSTLIALNNTDVRTLFQKTGDQTTISLSDGYGKSSGFSSATITPNKTNVTFTDLFTSASVVFSIATTPSISGTLYYTIEHISTDVNDFSGTPMSGNVSISFGSGSVTVNINPMFSSPEPNETFRLHIRKDSVSGAIIASSDIITISTTYTNDSPVIVANISPTPEYIAFDGSTPKFVEGTTYTLTLYHASNTFNGTVYWRYSTANLSGNVYESADFSTISGTVSFTNGVGYLTITPLDDRIRDYTIYPNSGIFNINEPVTLELSVNVDYSLPNSLLFIIEDTGPPSVSSVSISPGAPYQEGVSYTATINFNKTTINPYNLAVSGAGLTADVTFDSSITVNSGVALFNFTTKRDFVTEGTELIQFTLTDSTNKEVGASNTVVGFVSVSVLDTTTALTLSPNITTVVEGDTVTFTISAGSYTGSLDWQIVSTGSTALTAADFTGNSLTGTVNIVNGSATIPVGIVDDWTTERTGSSESFQLRLIADGTIITTSSTISVTQFTPTITVVPDSYNVNEGDTVTVTVTLNRPYNTTLYGGVFSTGTDVSVSTINIPIVNGVGTWITTIIADSITEGTETVTYAVYYESGRTTLLAQSTPVTVNDTSKFCDISASATSINEGDKVTFTFTNGPASGTYYLTLSAVANSLSIFDFAIGDGILYNNTTKYLGTITFSSGNATFIAYTTADASSETTETAFALDIRSTSQTGTILGTTPTIAVTDLVFAPSAWHSSTVSSATSTGNLTIDATAANSKFLAVLTEIAIGTINDTTLDAGWSNATYPSTSARISYKKLSSADANVVVSNLGSSNDRVMAHYFYMTGVDLTNATVTVLVSNYSTAGTGAVGVVLDNFAGAVLGSNEMGIFLYSQYASSTSAFTFSTVPSPMYQFSNSASAFQKSIIKVYQPGSKIPWYHDVTTSTVSGTVRRICTLLKVTW